MRTSANEHIKSVVSRYDEFQAEAVNNLLVDYRDKRNGRFLLVIPTGGGKTYTAVKAINRFFSDGLLDPDSDQVVWGAHRKELVKQAENTFAEYADSNPGADYRDSIKIGMMSEIMSYVNDNTSKVRIAVIDEAHHAVSKNITYGPLFDNPNLGILGLTATPSRHDGEPLDFEKESFSIGFPDMVERQLILSPNIDRVEGGRFNEVYAKGITGFSGLDELNSPDRDKKIIGQLLDGSDRYQKVIIYAATKAHVRGLYERIRKSELANRYESIDFILGGNEYSGDDHNREDFICRVKGYKRSIIVNCDVLTEGYDDPIVNTVVMATPTRSKLVYMQAIGRCIRVDKENPLKQAYIVEVVDDLPNIRYRINNRWLFSEISDALEPAVEDCTFSSATEFREVLKQICEQNDVPLNEFVIPDWDKSMRYSLLLFRSYIGNGQYRHFPILIDGQNRHLVSNWFNYLSERMGRFLTKSFNFDAAMKWARFEGISGLEDPVKRQLIYESMQEAHKVTTGPNTDGPSNGPWIKYVAFRYKATELSSDLLAFLDDVVNKDQLANLIKSRSFRNGDYLIKLPLPLAASIGMIMSEVAFGELERLIDQLMRLRHEIGEQDHSTHVDNLLRRSVVPIPPMFVHSLPTVIRENTNFSIQLD